MTALATVLVIALIVSVGPGWFCYRLLVDRGHTWTHQGSGKPLDDYTLHLEPYGRSPEELLPAWAITAYRALRGTTGA